MHLESIYTTLSESDLLLEYQKIGKSIGGLLTNGEKVKMIFQWTQLIYSFNAGYRWNNYASKVSCRIDIGGTETIVLNGWQVVDLSLSVPSNVETFMEGVFIG